jgi:hypothetical protein
MNMKQKDWSLEGTSFNCLNSYFLFVFDLFSDDVNSSGYTVSNDRVVNK